MISRSVSTSTTTIEARFTGADDGDFFVALPASELGPRRALVHPRPWVWLRQVHGAGVVEVADAAAAERLAGTEADAVVTVADDLPVAIHTADCGPVLLVGDSGQLGVAHAGWKGVMAGVLGETADALRRLGALRLQAVLGPAIGPECYEFSPDDLSRLEQRLGPSVRATTSQGNPALDMRAAVRQELISAGIEADDIEVIERCTACDPGFFSHRARVDRGRQALVAWRALEE